MEREEVQEFMKNQLKKKYIRLLKLSQISLVFFMPRWEEDGAELSILEQLDN